MQVRGLAVSVGFDGERGNSVWASAMHGKQGTSAPPSDTVERPKHFRKPTNVMEEYNSDNFHTFGV